MPSLSYQSKSSRGGRFSIGVLLLPCLEDGRERSEYPTDRDLDLVPPPALDPSFERRYSNSDELKPSFEALSTSDSYQSSGRDARIGMGLLP